MLANTDGKYLNSKSPQRTRRSTYTVLGMTISHHHQHFLSFTAPVAKQSPLCIGHRFSCFSASAGVFNVVNGSKDIPRSAVGIEAKYKASAIREQDDTNASKSLGDFEGHDHSFHKVEAAFEISFAIGFNASRTVDNKNKVNFCLANCKEIDTHEQ